MEIPKKVKIGPHWFDIELAEVVNKFTPRKGEIHLIENTIKIDKSIAQSKQEETLFHEALHEISNAVAVELDEGDVTRLAYGFYMFLVDNELLKRQVMLMGGKPSRGTPVDRRLKKNKGRIKKGKSEAKSLQPK